MCFYALTIDIVQLHNIVLEILLVSDYLEVNMAVPVDMGNIFLASSVRLFDYNWLYLLHIDVSK